MSMLRKAINRSASQLSARAVTTPVMQVSSRSFASVLESRESHEETQYIRQKENEIRAQRRAEVERILALDPSSKERQALLEGFADSGIMEKEPEASLDAKKPDGILAKAGLDDWKFALPIGLFLAIPALHNEIIVLNEETQMIGCFGLFIATLYTQVGPMVTSAFKEYAQDTRKVITAIESGTVRGLQSAIDINRQLVTIGDDFKSLSELSDGIKVVQAEAAANKAIYDHHTAVVQQLDTLVTLEENAVQALRARMIKKVKADALETLTNDKKVKEASLNRAIEYLAGGAKGPLGKDIVGDVFQQSLVNYRDSYAKQSGTDPIIKQLEADVEKLFAPKAAASAHHH